MAVHKQYLGLNEDGSPRFHYYSDDPNDVLVVTGPIYGPVVVDGEEIDVTDDVIAVSSLEQASKVSDAIGERHVAEGHPLFRDDPLMPNDGFVHVASAEAKTTSKKKG